MNVRRVGTRTVRWPVWSHNVSNFVCFMNKEIITPPFVAVASVLHCAAEIPLNQAHICYMQQGELYGGDCSSGCMSNSNFVSKVRLVIHYMFPPAQFPTMDQRTLP